MLNLHLNKVSSINDKAALVEKFHYQDSNYGATYFSHRMKPEPGLPVYRDRTSLAYYVCRLSAKLSLLAYLVHEICVVNARKTIIFYDWPAISWLLERLIIVLEYDLLSIRAKYKSSEREAAINAFNEKTNSMQALVTSLKVYPTMINLQKDCADVVSVDVPSNAQSTQ